MAIFTLTPSYHDRIWGGNNLHTLFGRTLPGDRIGESWEVCDRAETQTLLVETGQTLHELWTGKHRDDFFGNLSPQSERFPILIKLLDACDKLSLQVHPPEALAAAMKGEPKTELWYFLETQPGAEILVGLKKGVTRATFEKALEEKKLIECFHHLPTSPGEVMFLPSGRVHAIGAGNLILEIQQNSDTTYRVHDYDRIDAKTGKPRDLHVAESMKCIRFDDIEPIFTQVQGNSILDCKYFAIHRHLFFEKEGRPMATDGRSFLYMFSALGRFKIGGQEYPRGTSLLVGADTGEFEVESLDDEGHLITVGWPST
ncbi:MAG: type I phosphomannose isomerase catalytic subunit [Candidatus Methylacidiphilales bacterium]|nr:type I phosphomannose isomerase catalytic subunit [Candidatus Methylacidiphilales bacterium]